MHTFPANKPFFECYSVYSFETMALEIFARIKYDPRMVFLWIFSKLLLPKPTINIHWFLPPRIKIHKFSRTKMFTNFPRRFFSLWRVKDEFRFVSHFQKILNRIFLLFLRFILFISLYKVAICNNNDILSEPFSAS